MPFWVITHIITAIFGAMVAWYGSSLYYDHQKIAAINHERAACVLAQKDTDNAEKSLRQQIATSDSRWSSYVNGLLTSPGHPPSATVNHDGASGTCKRDGSVDRLLRAESVEQQKADRNALKLSACQSWVADHCESK